MIKDHSSSSLDIEVANFKFAPFYEKGGPVKASHLFGPTLDHILKELNEYLVE